MAGSLSRPARILIAARDDLRLGGVVPILWRGSSPAVRTAAGRPIPGTSEILSFSTGPRSCQQKEANRTGSRTRFPASNQMLTLAALSERLRRHSRPECSPRGPNLQALFGNV